MRINSNVLSNIFRTNKNEINKFCSHLLKKKLNGNLWFFAYL